MVSCAQATKEGHAISLNIGEDIQKINKALDQTRLGDSDQAAPDLGADFGAS